MVDTPATRRAVLVTIAGIAASAAGCSAVGSEPSVTAISLDNADDRSHSVSVRVEHDGGSLLERSYSLAACRADADSGHRISASEWGGTVEPFTLSARLDDTAAHASRSVTAGSHYDTLTIVVEAIDELSITVSDG